MQVKIILDKMGVQNATPIQYYFINPDNNLCVNDFLGKNLTIAYTGNQFCIKCGRKSNKLFGQGFCYPCFITAPEAEVCILHPKMCRAHEGVARDLEYAQQHCLIDHYVYLAATEHIKVGVTRYTQIPIRWIDQGALLATIIAKTPNRYTAGIIEASLKSILPDKTNWRSMLTNELPGNINFEEKIKQINQYLPDQLKQYLLENQPIENFKYPVISYPKKVKSIDLLKEPVIWGKLVGIKGQYLIFENGHVINMRKHSGFEVELTVH